MTQLFNKKYMFKCKYCESKSEMRVFVPFQNTKRQWVGDPAWNFHIKSICANCHMYNGFIKQTPELMEELKNNTFCNLEIDPKRVEAIRPELIPFADHRDIQNS